MEVVLRSEPVIDARQLLTAALTTALTTEMGALISGGVAQAQTALQVPLECQLQGSGWQPCTLTIERMGEHWWLLVDGQRLDFRSDGKGSVTLSDASGRSQAVQPVWTAQHALCWDGVCAKGDLPLD